MVKNTKTFFLILILSSCYSCTTQQKKSEFDPLGYRCNISNHKTGEGAVFFRAFERNQLGEGAQSVAGLKIQIDKLDSKKRSPMILQADLKDFGPDRGMLVNLPVGSYKIRKLSMIHKTGAQIELPFEKPKNRFFIYQKCVSNIGDFTVDVNKDSKIKTNFNIGPASFEQAQYLAKSDRASILNGFAPEEFPDLNVDDSYNPSSVAIAKIKTTQMVKTSYSFDSDTERNFTKQFVTELRKNENIMNRCLDPLLTKKNNKVEATFKIEWSFRSAKANNVHIQSPVKENAFYECLKDFIATLKSSYTTNLEKSQIQGKIIWTLVGDAKTKQVSL